MRLARWIFLLVGLYGLLVSTPLYFLEEQIGREFPPAINHPEYFYGFAGLCVVWQLMFLLIATDPKRYRPVMPIGVLEKLGWVIAVPILYAQHRVAASVVGFAAADALMAVLFVVAYVKTPRG